MTVILNIHDHTAAMVVKLSFVGEFQQTIGA